MFERIVEMTGLCDRTQVLARRDQVIKQIDWLGRDMDQEFREISRHIKQPKAIQKLVRKEMKRILDGGELDPNTQYLALVYRGFQLSKQRDSILQATRRGTHSR